MSDFIRGLPKAELHLHIEGTLEPDLMFDLAGRNSHELPFESVDEVKSAYEFTDLQSFLDIYYRGAAVLQTPEDFYLLISSYLERAAADGVRRAEIFFDPQTHTERGVGFPVFMEGLRAGMAEAESRFGISSGLILCFLRHLSGEQAVETIRAAEDHLEGVIAVGLDSSERGRPPELFEEAYAIARELGLRAVAHAGEEGPPAYVRGALEALGAERIDHGIRSLEDPDLVEWLARDQVPLTVCPLSNLALQVVESLEVHPLSSMIEAGLNVCLNSDDPAYFGGYVGDNYTDVQAAQQLDDSTMVDLARRSIEASFLEDAAKEDLLLELESFVDGTHSS